MNYLFHLVGFDNKRDFKGPPKKKIQKELILRKDILWDAAGWGGVSYSFLSMNVDGGWGEGRGRGIPNTALIWDYSDLLG